MNEQKFKIYDEVYVKMRIMHVFAGENGYAAAIERRSLHVLDADLLPAPLFAVGEKVQVSLSIDFKIHIVREFLCMDLDGKYRCVDGDPKQDYKGGQREIRTTAWPYCRKLPPADTQDKLLDEAMGILKEVETLPMKVAEKIRPLLERHGKLKCATAESKSQG